MATHSHFLWRDIFKKLRARRSDIFDILKENILFCTLSRRELSYLSDIVHQRTYQKDQMIFEQNNRGFGMYLIAKGNVAIRTTGASGEHQVTTLTQGSFFGELSLVDPDSLRTATAVSMERTVLIGFFKPDLLEIMERHPAMGVKILYQLSVVLGRRLLETTEKITLLSQARSLKRAPSDVI